ncbi:MAG: single-stranded DNA-binding protein [Synergistales bacterium]|nr:single-stranded DNA-binding protein [Synergistales bacterium]
MARGFNKAILVGNLARDPEMRYTASKTPVARLVVAVNRTWKGRDGELQEEVSFIPVTVFGSQAENCERYLSKGRPVLVEGRIRVSSYEKEGQKRTFTEVVAQTIQFLGGGGRREDSDSAYSGEGASGRRNGGSLREEEGFGNDFPMDFSEMGDSDNSSDDSGGKKDDEVDIPF